MKQSAIHFQITGMDCPEEIAILKRTVGPLVGGDSNLTFDLLDNQMSVRPNETTIDTRAIIEAIAKTGMGARLAGQTSAEKSTTVSDRATNSTVLSGLFLVAGLVIHYGFSSSLEASGQTKTWETACLVASLIFGVRPVLHKAFVAARLLQPDMHLLMVIAITGAILIGELEEAASVAFLFALSNALEAWSVGRARRAISTLLDLTPPTAIVLAEGQQERVAPVAEISIGSTILIRPGDRIPLDGKIVAGESTIDQANVTGESIPVLRKFGDSVFAGTINTDGVLQVETTTTIDNSTVARIAKTISEAQSHRSNSEQWVDRFARIYTPAVMLIALAVFLLPPLVLGQAWSIWFYRSLVLLVIACPCALVISTPVSIVAGLTSAARHGILVKGGLFLELPARVAAMAFDKTGTLTEGRPQVNSVTAFNPTADSELLAVAASLEHSSTHPLAAAIVHHAVGQNVTVTSATNIQSIPGKGITGLRNGQNVWLGSPAWVRQQYRISAEAVQTIEELSQSGQTIVAVGQNDEILGIIGLADQVRSSAIEAIHRLRRLGIKNLTLLTGDSQSAAERLAKPLELDDIRAELLPEQKVSAIRDLVNKYQHVIMVGDGINDAPALAVATVGIAMGTTGSDVTVETADVALMSNSLTQIPWLISLSRRTVRIIQQNIWLSLSIKILFAVMTFAGYSSLWAAIAADTGTSLLVIFNGLRLLQDVPSGRLPNHE